MKQTENQEEINRIVDGLYLLLNIYERGILVESVIPSSSCIKDYIYLGEICST
jgi:hypothetical protein